MRDKVFDEFAHRLGKVFEADGFIDHLPRVILIQRLEVGEEHTGLSQVVFRLLVIATNDGIVRPLEEAVFTVVGEFQRRVGDLFIDTGNLITGNNDRGGDVIFHLDLGGRRKVLAQAEDPPAAVFLEAHPQVAGDQFAVPVFQLMAGVSVDHVDGEPLPPVVAPVRFIKAFDQEDELLDSRRNRFDERIVLVGIIVARRQELDHRAQRTLRTED